MEIVDEFVDESGKAVRGRNTLEADGAERAGRNGYAISATMARAYWKPWRRRTVR